MMLLSANLGFLFTGLPLADRVRAARDAGFDAVEFHDQVQTADMTELRAALHDMPVLALNTFMGETMGRAALSRPAFAEDFARATEAAQTVGARAIHVVAGRGAGDQATYLANLAHALDRTPCPLLIEPISTRAAPGYFLSGFEQACRIATDLGDPKLRVMADWYHLRADHDLPTALDLLKRNWHLVGHVQVARPGDRGAPDPRLCPEMGQLLHLLRGLECAALGFEYEPDACPVQDAVATVAAFHRAGRA
jgi:hydroxypyruvate isomerase